MLRDGLVELHLCLLSLCNGVLEVGGVGIILEPYLIPYGSKTWELDSRAKLEAHARSNKKIKQIPFRDSKLSLRSGAKT